MFVLLSQEEKNSEPAFGGLAQLPVVGLNLVTIYAVPIGKSLLCLSYLGSPKLTPHLVSVCAFSSSGLTNISLSTLSVCPHPSDLWVHPQLLHCSALFILFNGLGWWLTHSPAIPESHKGLDGWVSVVVEFSSQLC